MKECTLKQRYKIKLSENQRKAIDTINFQKVFYDDNHTPPHISVYSYADGRISGSLYIEYSIFKSLEMASILAYKRNIGHGLHIFRIDRRYLQKVV